ILQAARNCWVNFLYNHGEDLDFIVWANKINTEVIQIANISNKDKVLEKLAEYVRKSGSFAK
ncbi:13627_t:CDS:1, partial [Dentiscutata heterogama]